MISVGRVEHSVLLLLFLVLSLICNGLSSSNHGSIQALQQEAIQLARSGQFLHAANRFEELGLYTNSPEAYFNAGLAYIQGSDRIKAAYAFEKCSTQPLVYRPCLIKLASLHRDNESYIETQKLLHMAIKLEPSQPDAYGYLADTYNNLKQFPLAIEYYRKALNLKPDVKLKMSLGDTYLNTKQYENASIIFAEAIDDFNRLPEKDSQRARLQIYFQALLGYFFSALELGYWYNYEANEFNLLSLTKEYNDLYEHQYRLQMKQQSALVSPSMPPNILSPYRLLFFQFDPKEQFIISNQWSSRLSPSNIPQLPPPQETTLTERAHQIRLGYLSRRFHDYPGTQMMIRLFGEHSRDHVNVTAIAAGPDDGSKYREHIRKTSDSLIDISLLSFKEGLQTLVECEFDIIVDYDGLHDFNSIKYMSTMDKVIKITWLGYAGTTGAGGVPKPLSALSSVQSSKAFDCILGDAVILPPDMTHTQYYSEKIIYLPGSYQPQDELKGKDLYDSASHYLGQDTDRTAARNSFLDRISKSLTRDERIKIANKIWLISFNRLSKITPDAVNDWMQILVYNPKAILILMVGTENMKKNIKVQCPSLRNVVVISCLQMEAAYYGVSDERLLFIPHLNMNEYRTLLRLSDLFLDTRNYNAHTVAADAISEETPILTLQGTTFGSRVAASLNRAIGMDSLLTAHSRKEYVDTGITVVQDFLYHEFRHLIKEEKGTCLFNSSMFARKLEVAYAALIDLSSIGVTKKGRYMKPNRIRHHVVSGLNISPDYCTHSYDY